MAGTDTEAKDTAGVIVRPPLLYLAGLAAGLGLSWLWPVGLGLAPLARYLAGGALIALALGVMTDGMLRFRRAGTEVHPTRPTTALVTTGVFALSRNPLYCGLSAILAGLALVLDSAWTLGMLVPVLLVLRYGVIAREEAYLERLFGEDYRRYKARVRRWL